MGRQIISILLFILMTAGGGTAEETAELLIMATTDLHCQLVSDSLHGGSLAKVETTIRTLRIETEQTVLLDAGDAFEGNAVADFYALIDTAAIHPLAQTMNRLEYDAMTLGNHEFTYGLEFLQRLRRELSCPLLAANISSGEGWWPDHVLLRRAGVKVLVVGTTTPWTALMERRAVDAGVQFHPQAERLGGLLPILRERYQPDIVCVLAHTGEGPEEAQGLSEHEGLALLKAVPGIDLLVLGHSHRTVNRTVGSTLVLQAGAHGSHVALARFRLNRLGDRWTISGVEGEVRSTESVAPDSLSQARFAQVIPPVELWLDEQVGCLKTPLSSAGSYSRMDPLSAVIFETMIQHGHGDLAMMPALPEDLYLPSGPVLRRDLYLLQPYLNHLVTVELDQNEVAACLERAASVWAPYRYDGSYPPVPALGERRDAFVVAGDIPYTLDYTKPAGARLVNIGYSGKPSANSPLHHVVISSYLNTGAYGYTWLEEAPKIRWSSGWLRSYLEEWFEAHPDYEYRETPGWKSRPTYQGHWAQDILDRALKRSGHDLLASIELYRGPMDPFEAKAAASMILDRPLSDQLERVLSSTSGMTRGKILGALVRQIPRATTSAGVAARRFPDIMPEESVLYDSIVATGLTINICGDSLLPGTLVQAGEYLGILANARHRTICMAASNDFHGALEPNPRRRAGGIGAASAWLRMARRDNPEGIVLLDAGDAMQGTPISNLFNGESTIAFYNELEYDALTLGNHDFDWGQDVLRARADQASFPFLSANVVREENGEPLPYIRPWTMVERGGIRIGVIGVTTPATPMITLADNVAGLSFLDPVATVKSLLEEVKASQPDLVVVVGHLGMERSGDRWIGEAASAAGDLAPYADLFFNGHTHQIYATELRGLPMAQGGSSGRAFSVARVRVDRNGKEEPLIRVSNQFLDPRRFSDEAVDARVAEYREELAPLTQMVVAELAEPLSRRPSEAGEMPLGRAIAESQLRMVPGSQICLMNPGGVRADLAAGLVTWQDLFTVQPFGNTLMKADLSGRDLILALENGIGSRGATVQVAGINVLVDRSKPFGSRVIRVSLEDGTPVVDDESYVTVFNNFMGGGGDNYYMLKDAKDKVDTGHVDLAALIAYLTEQAQPVRLTLNPCLQLAE